MIVGVCQAKLHSKASDLINRAWAPVLVPLKYLENLLGVLLQGRWLIDDLAFKHFDTVVCDSDDASVVIFFAGP